MAQTTNVYSPEYDNEGNPKPSIRELKDAIQGARNEAEGFRDDSERARDVAVDARDMAVGANDDAEQTAKDIGAVGGVDDTVQTTGDLPSSTGDDSVFYVLDDTQYYQDTGAGSVAGGWEKVGPNISLDATQIGHVVSMPRTADSKVFITDNFASTEDAIQAAVDYADNNGGGLVALSESVIPFDETSVTVPGDVFLHRPERPAVDDIEEISSLRDLSTDAASAAYVRSPWRKAGPFIPTSSDPFGRGDDLATAVQYDTGEWWARADALEENTYRATWFGDANDQTIQDALDAATSDSGVSRVLLDHTHAYDINNPIVFNGGGVVLEGAAGNFATFDVTSSISKGDIILRSDGNGYIGVRKIGINGNNRDVRGLLFDDAERCFVEEVGIYDVSSGGENAGGIRFRNANGERHVRVENCWIIDPQGVSNSSFGAITISGAEQFVVKNNFVEGGPRSQIELITWGQDPNYGIVTGNVCFGSAKHAVDLENCAKVLIQENYFRDSTNVGISDGNQSGPWVAKNNVIENVGSEGIYQKNVNVGCDIVGNIIRNAGNSGIVTNNGSQVYVEGNTVSNCGKTSNASLTVDASHSIIANNRVFGTKDNATGLRFASESLVIGNQVRDADSFGCETAFPSQSVFAYNRVQDTDGVGIYIDRGDFFLCVGNVITNAGRDTALTDANRSAIKTRAQNAETVDIRDNVLLQSYRAFSVDGGHSEVAVVGNRAEGCNGVGTLNADANIGLNFGQLNTRDRGTVTITAGNTSNGISYSVFRAGIDPEDVRVTPISDLGAASHWWVSDVGNGNFKINVDADPGVDIQFSWQLEVRD